MKKTILKFNIFFVLSVFLLTGCKQSIITSQTMSSGLDIPIGAPDPPPGPQLIDRENLPAFNFESTEDIINISDENLSFIARELYESSDFIEDYADIDLFGIDVLNAEDYPMGEQYPASAEPEKIEIVVSNYIPENVDRTVDSNQLKELMDREFETERSRKNITKEDIIYCGENDYYSEYAWRYVYETDSNVYTKSNRKIYLKTLGTDYEGSLYMYQIMGRWVFLGDLTKENVRNTFDLYFEAEKNSKNVYREIIENEDEIIYSNYGIALDMKDYGVNGEAILFNTKWIVDKNTHEISSRINEIKRIEAENTEQFGYSSDY